MLQEIFLQDQWHDYLQVCVNLKGRFLVEYVLNKNVFKGMPHLPFRIHNDWLKKKSPKFTGKHHKETNAIK